MFFFECAASTHYEMRGPDEFSGHAVARARYVRASDLVGSRDRQGRKRVLLVHGADVALGGLRGEGGPHPAAEHSKDEERSPHGKPLSCQYYIRYESAHATIF